MTRRRLHKGSGVGSAPTFSLAARARQLLRFVVLRASSSLVRRIVVLNLAGLVALLLGFLYLNQFRQGLIDSRFESLLTQGEIIASAVAASATIEVDSITVDPEKLLRLQAGESTVAGDDDTEFSINPARVAPLLRRLVTPTRTRARIFDQDGELLIDTAAMYSRGEILKFELEPPTPHPDGILARIVNFLTQPLPPKKVATSEVSLSENGHKILEVNRAFDGAPASVVSVNSSGETIVSVAIPIQRSRIVRGVLLISTLGGDIDNIIKTERFSIIRIFSISASVMLIVSALFAGTIAGPIRRLSSAADRVRRGITTRSEIPDFTLRSDEIGHLSGSLRDMTRALYDRIEAIESFAADVAHELKNPLTSLRSAVETWPLAKTEESRERLLSVIIHDVRRLDRLISDISDASRLDAELARNNAEPFNLIHLISAVVEVSNSVINQDNIKTVFIVSDKNINSDFMFFGHDSRISQVIVNLIDNAKSFSKPDGEVRVILEKIGSKIEIRVEDEGPGIPAHALEKIFERFYTDRPDHGFGQNSGLGLSISRQIISAHRGVIWAENRYPESSGTEPIGARFIISLPIIEIS